MPSLHTLALSTISLLLRPAAALYNSTRHTCSYSSGMQPAIYIIADMHPTTPEQQRVAQHVRELSSLFAPTVPVIMSPIMARKCKDPATSSSYDKGHGSNLAHWSAWNDFARNSYACSVIVFEYDAFAASATSAPDAIVAARALQEQSEFLFLGYCFKSGNHPAQSGAAPYCLHAYAASLSGVRKLLDHVDVCGLFADTQVADMCNRKLLNWNFTSSAAYDRAFVQRLFFDEGLHNGPFHFSGSFVQAKYDVHPSSLGLVEGSLVSVKSKGRAVFAVRNNHTWHKLDSMPESQMGKKNNHQVHVLSDWQFRQWPETN